ncbi:MAG: ABC transporter substrate-binding protein [Deltaproteobacteria bacterium]|nr:ABC transporter substrate-binding protein [Deltaproteobacteria bacterium]
MLKIFQKENRIGIIWTITAVLLLSVLAGCKASPKIFKIGIFMSDSSTPDSMQGFKQGMVELGYIEGRDIKYIHKSFNEKDEQSIDTGIKQIIEEDLDLLFSIGRGGALRAKKLVEGTDLPVLFCCEAWPEKNGLVESLSHPGGNLTGVKAANCISKALEWLVITLPETKKIWLPYNPDDEVSVSELPMLKKAAIDLGVELVLFETRSVEKSVAAIGTLPEDIDAVFRIPSPTLDRRNHELSQAAIGRGIPLGASIILDESVLITLTTDFIDAGKKTARLAQQIFQGVKPFDLPVETADIYLAVNMKTAETLGIEIPDRVLLQAKTIIR